ncbi:hypothetical protein C808_03315 [Lachnospiraceae bacterium M18-1]|nr:hypothetical protein C808_03315 [Lachnospiraceae bacterium M18-1]
MKKEIKVSHIFGYIFLGIFIVICVYPIIWLIINSFKSTEEFKLNSIFSLPNRLMFENYVDAWKTGNIGQSFLNSVVATALSMVIVLLTALPFSFAVSKMIWKFRKAVQSLIMFGMMVPVMIALIPLFTIYNSMNLTNSLIGLTMIYVAYQLPLMVMLFTGFFSSFPNEMLEAAVIDGCNIYQVLLKVALPLMLNSIITVETLQFMMSWNDLIFAQTMMSDTSKKTIQTALVMFNGSYGQVNWGPLLAAVSIAIVPTLVIYMFLSKFMMAGMTNGAVKG